ncbi:MAG: peptide ABC transporter substrate-binding protein [Methylotenera sp.]|nr:peptide ABC transporter substrate-binding protein [Methylotenera sp.]
MTKDIRESDWKVLKQLHDVALNRFCQRALSDFEGIATDTSRTPHQRYLSLYETVQRRDKEIMKVFDNLSRSRAFLQIVALHSRHLLENEEFLRFSEETRALVEVFLENHA